MMAGNEVTKLYELAKPILVNEFGRTIVIAPHQDDESLGCGGTIALLRQANIDVYVIFVSDGSMSHPGSKKYPVNDRIVLREKEAIAALQILGVSESHIHFMRLQDSEVPGENKDGFQEAVNILLHFLQLHQPTTLLVPWRRDPHKDHRAAAQIIKAVLKKYSYPIRLLEYFIWLWERSQPEELPLENEVNIWQVDITHVALQKQQAIMAHTSQVTALIDDDPNGFILSSEVLAHFSGNHELFAESLT